MARREALLRMHRSLTGRRDELRRRLGGDLRDLSNSEKGDATGDTADLAFDSSGEEVASQLAELELRELLQIERPRQTETRHLRPLRRVRQENSRSPVERPAIHRDLHRMSARDGSFRQLGWRPCDRELGQSLRGRRPPGRAARGRFGRPGIRHRQPLSRCTLTSRWFPPENC